MKWYAVWTTQEPTEDDINRVVRWFGIAYLYKFDRLFYVVNQELIPDRGGQLLRIVNGN